MKLNVNESTTFYFLKHNKSMINVMISVQYFKPSKAIQYEKTDRKINHYSPKVRSNSLIQFTDSVIHWELTAHWRGKLSMNSFELPHTKLLCDISRPEI